jgi:hypothetical protein
MSLSYNIPAAITSTNIHTTRRTASIYFITSTHHPLALQHRSFILFSRQHTLSDIHPVYTSTPSHHFRSRPPPQHHQEDTVIASYPMQPSIAATTMSRSVAAPRSRPQRPAGPRDPPQPRDGDTRHHFSALAANSILSRGPPPQPRDPGNGRHGSMRGNDPQPRDPGNGRHSMRGKEPQPRDPPNGRTMAYFDPQPRDPGM